MDASELYDPEFRKLIKEKKPTIIIPVGSIEQHGAHLPITTDSDIVTSIASRLAKQTGEKERKRINKLSTKPGGFPKVAKNGVWGDPTSATKKDGEKFLAEIVRNLAKECQS